MEMEASFSFARETAAYCSLFGMVVGGAREWHRTAGLVTASSIRIEEAKLRTKHKDWKFTSPKARRMLAYHAWREAFSVRALRVAWASTKGGLAFGLISVSHFMLEQGAEAVRGEVDAWNTVAATSALGAAIGSTMGIRGAFVGTLAAALVAFPIGHAKGLLATNDKQEAQVVGGAEVIPAKPKPKPKPERRRSLWGRILTPFKGSQNGLLERWHS